MSKGRGGTFTEGWYLKLINTAISESKKTFADWTSLRMWHQESSQKNRDGMVRLRIVLQMNGSQGTPRHLEGRHT